MPYQEVVTDVASGTAWHRADVRPLLRMSSHMVVDIPACLRFQRAIPALEW